MKEIKMQDKENDKKDKEILNTKKFKLDFHWQILIGMICGTALGYTFYLDKTFNFLPSFITVNLFSWVGALFLKLLKLIVIPLIFCSLINGITSLQRNQLGKLGAFAFSLFITSISLATVVGMSWVNLIKPGIGFDVGATSSVAELESIKTTMTTQHGHSLLDFIPNNFFFALSQDNQIIQIILCALVFGVTIITLGEKVELVKNYFQQLFQIVLKITSWVMKLTPIGVFGLLTQSISLQGFEPFFALGKLFITVMIALFTMLLVVYPLLLYITTRITPLTFYSSIRAAMLTAFSTGSSVATIPVTSECMRKMHVPPSIRNFVVPTSASMNLNGTAIYEGVVVLFLSQAYLSASGQHAILPLSKQLVLMFIILLTGIGTPGIPHASLVSIAMILKFLGFPLDALGLIISIDRLLDMFRTCVNVTGDCMVTLIVNKFVKVSKDEDEQYEFEP